MALKVGRAMSPDNLRRMIGRYDRDNARQHRLTGEPVIAARADTTTRTVCGSCWHVVDERAEYRAWVSGTEKACGCWSMQGWPVRERAWAHWNTVTREYTEHVWAGISCCPRCSGELHEVVA